MVIPEYQRRKLASSLVGTPGVDTSGQRLGDAVASDITGVENSVYKVAVARQTALDNSVAFDNSLKFTNTAEQIRAQHRQDKQNSLDEPTVIAGELRDNLMKTRQDQADLITSPRAKAEFLRQSGATIVSQYKQELSDAGKNQVALAGEHFVSANNNIANGVYNAFASTTLTYDQKIEALKAGESNRQAAINILLPVAGMKETNKQNMATREGLVKAATLGLLEQSPRQALDFLKNPEVKDALGAEKHAELLDTAKKRAQDFKQIAQDRLYSDVAATNSDEIDKFQNGQQTLASIENIKDDKTRALLTKAYLDSNQVTPEEFIKREAALQVQFEDFFVRDKSGKLTGDIKKDKTPEDVVKFQQKFMAAMSGVGDKSRLMKAAKTYPDMLRQAIDNHKPNPFLERFVSFLNMVTFNKLHIGKDADQTRQKIEMTGDFYNRLEKIDPNNIEQFQTAVRDSLSQSASRSDPSSSKYKVGEKYTVAGRSYTAVRMPDGSIGLDDGQK